MHASAQFLHGIPSQIALLSPVTVTRQLRKSLDAASLKFVTVRPKIGRNIGFYLFIFTTLSLNIFETEASENFSVMAGIGSRSRGAFCYAFPHIVRTVPIIL